MQTGIYKIQSIKFPERIYIGSAICIESRKNKHRFQLNWGNHANAKLQNHKNKYTLYDLDFSIVELCSREKLLEREQFYIDTLKPFFNINPIAGSRLNTTHKSASRLKIIQAAKSRIPTKIRDIHSGKFVRLAL